MPFEKANQNEVTLHGVFQSQEEQAIVVAEQASEENEPIDNSLSDDEWLAQSKTRFDWMIKNYYGSCETIGEGGQAR